MSIKVIILDFDGVVVESVGLKTEAFYELFQEHKDLIDDIIKYHLENNAVSRFIKFKYIYENFLGKEYNEKTEEEVGKRFSEIVFQKVVSCPFVTGAVEFLQEFSKAYPIYLVSITPQEELDRIVARRDIKRYFRGVFGSPPGNKIDFIGRILEDEGAKPAEAIYIGDMIDDYRIAKETGVQFIGRRNTESFDGLDIPHFLDFVGIKEWIQDKIN